MEIIRLLAFPIHPVTDAFTFPKQEPFHVIRCPTSWNSENAVELSETLNCQIKNNYLDLNQLEIYCRAADASLFTTNYVDGQVVPFRNYYRSAEQKKVDCEKYLNRWSAYGELFQRDRDVFTQVDWDVQTYAIVLLYKGRYYGHIYAWISPIDPTFCFAMGIRARIDQVFLRKRLENVSGYLLDGVRRFAIAKGCQKVIVTYPFNTMILVLETLGFMRTPILADLLGRSLGGQELFSQGLTMCNNCHQYMNLGQSFVTTPVEFELIG